MPTGFTHPVAEGKCTTLRDFALECSRAFGALVMMRDEPSGAPVPEAFTPSDYNLQAEKKARALLARLLAMKPAQRIKYGQKEKTDAAARYDEYERKQRQENERYSAMREQVLKWIPPSPDHSELKNFMLNQLEISMESGGYWQEQARAIQAKEPIKFYEEAVEKAAKDIAYHANAQREENERTEVRNRWLAQLRASLN